MNTKVQNLENSQSTVEVSEDQMLEKYGYKAELYRGFNSFMAFSFCFTAVAVISSITVTFGTGLATGGPAVLIWGWIIGSCFTLLVGLSMAEICSTYPTAGSVYHWAGMLATKSQAPAAAYICGWFNFLGNAAGDASFSYGFASTVAAADILSKNDGSQWENWQVYLLCVLISLIWAIKNCMRSDSQGWFNNVGAVYQVLSTFIIVITILSVAKSFSSSQFVWDNFQDQTGLNGTNRGYIMLIGLLNACYGFSGYEAAGHMSEETKNASESAPKGILFACISTALTGLAFLLGLLYASEGNLDGIDEGASDSKVVNIFSIAFDNKIPGALAMTCLLIINLFFAGFSSMTVTSRIGFAMARDGAIPFSSFFAVVDNNTQVPIRMTFLCFFIDCLMCLLILQSDTAFAAITSITAIGYQISYMIPIFFRLTVSRNSFKQSSFSLGKLSQPIGWIAVIWLTFTSILFIFPSNFPNGPDDWSQTQESLNWTGPVTGLVLVISFIYWWLPSVGARNHFVGPKRDDYDIKQVKHSKVHTEEIRLDRD